MSWQPETCLLLVAELRSAAIDSRLRNLEFKPVFHETVKLYAL